MQNPFNVTKASEFSDAQINQYWVGFGRNTVLNPHEYTPKYILGGKGSGKTHLLRYYSYPLQKLRNGSIKGVLMKDKYIGIYSIFSTLDASRFVGKNVSEDQWKAVFKYYFELYIGSFVLKTIAEFIESEPGREKEESFVKAVMDLFLVPVHIDNYDLESLIRFVETQRREIDFLIENIAFSGDFRDVKVYLKSGSLIFGVPEELGRLYEDFRDVGFIYIMDEYEKLFEWQKRYVNSLVWEKRRPSTFWIGARKYGYTDMRTETGEVLKKGSEYNPFFIDDYYQRNEKEYAFFARELISKRLGAVEKNPVAELEAKFEYGKDGAVESIQAAKRGNYKHLRNLTAEIGIAIKKSQICNKEEDIDHIVNQLVLDTKDNPLEQKYKLYLFYQLWAERKTLDLKEIASCVSQEYREYQKGKSQRFSNIVEKYKNDFLAQLCEENGVEYYAYSGLEDYIKLSWGNPRVLLLLLKNTIEKSQIFHEHPLESGGFISLRAQYLGIKETSQWYLGDVELMGEMGSDIDTAINNLAKYLRLFRFSDKPTDTSVCAFNFGAEGISQNAIRLIQLMELHSLLIRIDNERKQKNSGKAEITYQLNRILAPNWNLPASRRGVADFSNTVIEVIFNRDSFSRFDAEYVSLKNRMNAPFMKKGDSNSRTLF